MARPADRTDCAGASARCSSKKEDSLDVRDAAAGPVGADADRTPAFKLGGILVGLGVVPEDALLSDARTHSRLPGGRLGRAFGGGPGDGRAASSAKRAFRPGSDSLMRSKRRPSGSRSLDPSNIAALDEVASPSRNAASFRPSLRKRRLMQAHEKFYGRPLSQTFGNLLSRINRPKRAAAAEPARPPRASPPPQFGGPDTGCAGTSLETVSAFLPDDSGMDPDSSPPRPACRRSGAHAPPDPFSDG